MSFALGQSTLSVSNRLPAPKGFGPCAVLIYDRKLVRLVPGFKAWASRFPASWPVTAGERLKSVRNFPSAVERLAKIAGGWPPRETVIVAVGGGSVGDFAGFLASVFKRGVRLQHLPSTWLSALDSAHGGKTALNVGGFKNQIGTFYAAERTLLCRPLLGGQPRARAREATGELAKIALIDGGAWARRLKVREGREGEAIWKALSPAIEAKLRIVRRDPRETSGGRQVLNLGHTFGHVLESELGLAHGDAVAHGLDFALAWSAHRRLLSQPAFEDLRSFHREGMFFRSPPPPPLSERKLRAALSQDKKRERSGIVFIFVRGWGRTERVTVTIDEIVAEARRQGRVR